MPPKRAAPKPAGFEVASLQAGRRTWTAGRSGPLVKLGGAFGPPALPRREIILVGKVLFGRDRLAFEVQELDFDPASVKRLARLEKDRNQEAFGGWGSESDDAPDRGNDNFLHVFRATELAAKHSIQVKFEDIERIEISGGRLQMSLSKAPQCYIKPAGERRIVNMEVGPDITKGAKTIALAAAPLGEGEARRRRQENLWMLSLEAVREELARHSPRLAALLQGLPAPAPAPTATPRGKKRAAVGEELADSGAKQARPRAAARGAAARGASPPRPAVAPEGSWLKKAVEQFGLCGPVDESLTDDWWKMYVQERESLEREANEGGSDDEEFDPYQAEQTEPTHVILSRVRAAVRATVASSTSGLNPDVVARGVYLCSCYACMDEEDPRTVEAKALVFSPFANGRVVHIAYRNHFRARMSFTERDSHMCAFRGVVGEPPPPERLWEKLLDLDYNEFRRKNKVKTSIATKATIGGICSHLFGSEDALSNRKTFGLLIRAAGLGQYKESNGWPVAVMRRRFKCMPGERDTDTEKISGEGCEEPGIGCCVM